MQTKLNLTNTIAISGLGIAFVFATTYFGFPLGSGWFHFGDIAIVIMAIMFGPVIGAISALGQVGADISLGYLIYVPITLIVKTLMGYIIGKNKNIISLIISSAVVITGYTIWNLTVMGQSFAIIMLIGDLTQVSITIVAGTIISKKLPTNLKIK